MNISDLEAGYAYWISPDEHIKVIYSLAVFQEIDAVVNDGYRRIPHGGVETAGLLFGARNNNELQIEAMRPIQSQHAFGPSLILSPGDLDGIREQLRAATSDPELPNMRALGWFIGHSRSPLTLNDREVGWFQDFFPDPLSLTLLVKPERFQPTRFAFLLREQDGSVARDASARAVILPLSGQSGATGEKPARSIPAASLKPERPASMPESPASGGSVELVVPVPEAKVEPVVSAPEAGREPVAPAPEETVRFVDARRSPPTVTPEPPLPNRRVERFEALPRRTYAIERQGVLSGFSWNSIAILLLAAILGCAAGYWAYLQLPSPVIPVNVKERSGQLVVEWPVNQTDSAEYAALQVNNGQWIQLTQDQKLAGNAAVNVPVQGDVKIELLAKHWLRDSRGIVRYIRTSKGVPGNLTPAPR